VRRCREVTRLGLVCRRVSRVWRAHNLEGRMVGVDERYVAFIHEACDGHFGTALAQDIVCPYMRREGSVKL
jgi:hypothetical protein